MIFSIVVILLIAIIAYFHVVQGLFSSTISVICAIVAALMAISFHEQLAQLGFRQKLTDQGYALSLVGVFVVVYGVLRVIFDNVVPGNVRLPAIVDKVGGAILGAIAGAMALAIFSIAAQSLPLSPSIFGYSRYPIEAQRDVKIPPSGHNQYVDTYVFDELKTDDLKDEDHQTMFVPVDDMLINLTQKLSDGGSLAGERNSSVHPAYLDELFFNRLGVQTGGNHVMVSSPKQAAFTVQSARTADVLGQVDGEIKEIRVPKSLAPVRPTASQALLVIRVVFDEHATDSDHIIRTAPSSVRLVANSKNYLPLGTLENGGLYQNRADDFMFIEPNQPVDFVFVVDREDVITGTPPAPGARPTAANALSIKDGVFIEVKRMARVPLGGTAIEHGVPDEPSTGVQRKAGLDKPEIVTATTPAPTTPTPATPPSAAPSTPAPPNAAPSEPPPSAPAAGGGPVAFVSAEASDKLFTAIAVGQHGTDANDLKLKSGAASVKDGKLQKFELHPVDTLEDLAKGEGAVSQIFAPSGTHAVIVTVNAGAAPWAWAEGLSDFEVVDSSGIPYKPNGALATVTKDGKNYLVGNFNADEPVEKIAKQDGTPTKVAIIFLIPDNTPLSALNYKGQKIADVNLK